MAPRCVGISCARDGDGELVGSVSETGRPCVRGGTPVGTEMAVAKGDPGSPIDEKTLEERNLKASEEDA